MCASLKTSTTAGNRLLAALPIAEQARLLPALQAVTFAPGDIVYESGRAPEYVYFPTCCLVSLVYTTANGATAEMGVIGNDGVVGIALLTGGETVPNRAVVPIAGGALRMKADVAREEFERSGPLRRLVLRYMQALITQVSQTAVCNRLHSVEQRLCRWILLCRERLHSDELQMTQETISSMLGGRRQSVTIAAGRLQEAGLIRYARGHITIRDRHGLEQAACECYRVVKTEVDRLTDQPVFLAPARPVAAAIA